MFDDKDIMSDFWGYNAKIDDSTHSLGKSASLAVKDSGGGKSGSSDSRFAFKDWNWTGAGILGNDGEGGVNDHGLIGHKSGTLAIGYLNTIGTSQSVSSMSNSGAFLGNSFSSHDDVTNFRLAMTDIEYTVDKDGSGLTIGDVKFENMSVNEIESAMMDYGMRDTIAKSGITTQELAVSLRDIDARSVYSSNDFRAIILGVVNDRLGIRSSSENEVIELESVKDNKKDLKDASTLVHLSMDYGEIDKEEAEEESINEVDALKEKKKIIPMIPVASAKNSSVKKVDSTYKYKSDDSLYNNYSKVSDKFNEKENVGSKPKVKSQTKSEVSSIDYSSKSESSKQKPLKTKSTSSDGSGNRFSHKDWNWTGAGIKGNDGEGGVNDHESIGHKNGEVMFGYLNTNKTAGSLTGSGVFAGSSLNSHEDVNTYRLNNTDIKYSVDKDGVGMSIGDVKFENIHVNEVEKAFLDEELALSIAKEGLTSQDIAFALREIDSGVINNADDLKAALYTIVDAHNPEVKQDDEKELELVEDDESQDPESIISEDETSKDELDNKTTQDIEASEKEDIEDNLEKRASNIEKKMEEQDQQTDEEKISVEDIKKDLNEKNNLSAFGKVGLDNGEEYKYKESDQSFYNTYNRMSAKFDGSQGKTSLDLSSSNKSFNEVEDFKLDYGGNENKSATSAEFISGAFAKLKEQLIPTKHNEIELKKTVSKIDARDSDESMSVEPIEEKIAVEESVSSPSVDNSPDSQDEVRPDEAEDYSDVEPSVYEDEEK
ncbi:MAG: Unknown protein [uncultured Campylobacterales bacterium]|uniref:Uncharacterized protein n=1 Tax=uncultured Campylobacterales bacterium TaxID=352960 RepID=A0A6S6THG5_9BACT|nr:MAG: Unknown protein [uncultured Campylobacterales bacterium]